MNTLKKKVLYIFSLLFISTFLYAQIPNPIVLEWAFPDQPGVENPTSPVKDDIWFAPSTNNYDVLFDAKPASYGPGVERNGIQSCVNYFGIVSGVNGCDADDYAMVADKWTTSNSRSSGEYIEFEFDIGNMECYDFSNSTGVISFDAKRSKKGPKKIDVYAVATHPLFGEIELPFPNSTNLTVEFEEYPHPSWYSFSIDSSGIYGFNNLFDLVQSTGIVNIKIRIYGFRAGSGDGTLRIDNFRLELNDALDQSPTSFNDLSYPSEVCLESDLPVLNNLPENSNESSGEWSLEIENNIYTYTFTPDELCYAPYTFEVTIVELPEVDILDDVIVCESYELPNLSHGNYYTEPDGAGTELNAGDLITSSQTIYIYAETGGIPNCSNESSFDVTIKQMAEIVFESLTDLSICGNMSLPNVDSLDTEDDNNVAGTWSVVENNNVYTYTFTPTNECYEAYIFTVSVEEVITPNFEIPPSQCEGESFPLGNESPNGITGTWSPAFDSYNTTTYTFTPDAGQCASTQEVTIIIKDKPITSPIELLN